MNIDTINRLYRDRTNPDLKVVSQEQFASAPSLSADGRYVAWQATRGDEGVGDIYVHDRDTGQTACKTSALQLSSGAPQLSADGQTVAFSIAAAQSRPSQVVVVTGSQAEVATVNGQGEGAAGSLGSFSMSADGKMIAFDSTAGNLGVNEQFRDKIFVRDRAAGTTRCISPLDGDSKPAAISGDGQHVAFLSRAPSLATGPMDFHYQVYVHDCKSGETVCASVAQDGTRGNNSCMDPVLSHDGRYVAFISAATNLTQDIPASGYQVFVHDCQSGETKRLSHPTAAAPLQQPPAGGMPPGFAPVPAQGDGVAISGDGRYVAFNMRAGHDVLGSDGQGGVFVHDMRTGQQARVSVGADGQPLRDATYMPAMSADGRYVAFGMLEGTHPSVAVVRNILNEDLQKQLAEQAMQAPEKRGGQIVRDNDYINIGGVKVPVRQKQPAS